MDFDFVNRANAEYIDQLYSNYQRDPRSVEEHWRAFFAGFDAGAARSQTPGGTHPGEAPHGEGLFTTGIYDIVHSYRELGHFVAKLDPLGQRQEIVSMVLPQHLCFAAHFQLLDCVLTDGLQHAEARLTVYPFLSL